MYSTTFPCHNCAKHIVSAGIQRVVYVEPYPKSKASQLFEDAIAVDEELFDCKVLFQPFIGVGPRRFFDLFSMKLGSGYQKKRKENGQVVTWLPRDGRPRTSFKPSSYIEREVISCRSPKKWLAELGEDR